jgi:Leucine-rich repeat (LRR) protein
VNLESNQLSNLPKTIENLINLSYINLNSNRFESIPLCLFKRKNTINYLLINNNSIKRSDLLDEYIIEFSLLQLVDLRDNPVINEIKLNNIDYFNKITLLDNFMFILKKYEEN